MIKEDYVSFETAKLLKEKGFDEPCLNRYCTDGRFGTSICHYKNSEINKDSYNAPTLQMAMKWLREVYKILILVEYDCPVFSSDIYKMDDIDEYGSAKHISPTFANCKNYEQACEAALKYSLENLI